MNSLNFNQTGGFPLTTKILDELQKAFSVFNGLGALAGDKTIISGCVQTGTEVSDGVVYVNGEVFAFKGGAMQTKVRIVEVVENLAFQNGNSNPVIKTRFVQFGNGVGAMDWVDFTRPLETKELAALLNAKASKTAFDFLAAAFATALTKLNGIEDGAQKQPEEMYQYGLVSTLNRAEGDFYNDFTRNYYELLPPNGFTMAHLKAFIPSIAQINYAGNVDGNDVLWCKYSVTPTKILINCNNRENDSTPSQVSYLAIWKK